MHRGRDLRGCYVAKIKAQPCHADLRCIGVGGYQWIGTAKLCRLCHGVYQALWYYFPEPHQVHRSAHRTLLNYVRHYLDEGH